MTDGGLMAGSPRAVTVWKLLRSGGMTLAFLVLALSVLGPRSPGAHETIDADGVNAILAATDTAAARVKSVAGSVAEGEAMFALGMVQAEATAVLNRDLAAHSGQLTFNGQSLQKALAQRNFGAPLRRRNRPLPLADGLARTSASPLACGTGRTARAVRASESRLLRELRARSLPAGRHELR